MSLDMNGFLSDIKRAAIEAVNAGKPFAFALGKVTSTTPLRVQVDQKLELTETQLILTNAVRDYTVEMTVEHLTDSALANHVHAYSGNTQNGGEGSHTHAYSGSTQNGGDSPHTHAYSGNTQNGGDGPHMHVYSGNTESVNLTHSHSYSGTKSFRVHLGLSVGEQVLLLRVDGGQKYIILDRVEAPA